VCAALNTALDQSMSKNQQKKLAKLERRQVKLLEKKAVRKAEARQASEASLAERRARLDALSPEELAELAERRATAVAERKLRTEADRARREQSLTSAWTVVVDCAFGQLMTDKESKSLVAQFNHAYAANVRGVCAAGRPHVSELDSRWHAAAVPTRLCFTGLVGELAAGFDRHAGSDRWSVVRDSRSYLEVFADSRDSVRCWQEACAFLRASRRSARVSHSRLSQRVAGVSPLSRCFMPLRQCAVTCSTGCSRATFT